jgi:hypothetical protein
VTACGRICMHRKRINVSTVLAGQRLGVKDVDEGIWIVSFMRYDLGYVDLEQKTLRPLDNPFGPRLLPTYVLGTDRYLCLRSVPTQGGGDGLFRQAAPLLAKCDAPFPVPPFFPPIHRPAAQQRRVGDRHARMPHSAMHRDRNHAAATCWTAGNWITAASVTGVRSARVTGWPAQ